MENIIYNSVNCINIAFFADPATRATTQQSNKCSYDVIITLVGKATLFTVKNKLLAFPWGQF